MDNFRHLTVWQRAHALSVTINRHARDFPWYERTELGSQMRRSSTSVPFSIAEGCGRKAAKRSNADLLHRLSISSGSLHELDNQIEYAGDVEYLPRTSVMPLLEEVDQIRRMPASFTRAMREGDRHAR
ncbi:MAG TPA: four helix bundle protein [Gemmatimonadaceae bacterium]|nr:four helix bundle protein [Gemmatimonadaceae bacterium]